MNKLLFGIYVVDDPTTLSNAVFTKLAGKTASEEEADVLLNYAVELAHMEGSESKISEQVVP